ncbi:Pullulanase [Streptococcus oralis]|uniref:Pullulanase n=1 Tax=Streptococcus oralis TaxID=1303 RepID=A0A139RPA1_STROR|nr:Pullulanase [Streptococcus oralis]
MVYSIRSLKNGTGSLLISVSFVLLAMTTPTISANENTTTTNANNSETTTALAQALTDTAASTDKHESDFSTPKMQTLP